MNSSKGERTKVSLFYVVGQNASLLAIWMAIIVLFLYFVPLSLSQTLLLKGDAVRNATAVILTNNRSQAGVGWSRNSIILTPFGFTASFSYLRHFCILITKDIVLLL